MNEQLNHEWVDMALKPVRFPVEELLPEEETE